MSMTTRTGSFPIGFRRGGSPWQRDLSGALSWARQNGLLAIDLGRNPEDIAAAEAAGLHVGSVDLLDWQGLMSQDADKRAESVAKNAEYIAKCGARKYFYVALPEDPKAPRRENFALLTESLNALAPALEAAGGQLVIEGWPGPGALCCTPESYRATFEACPSPSIGINYDPSHLVRMGIDPIRFLKEFVLRVGHVHGKDCEVLADDVYEYGHEQPATFKENPFCGASAWRYTIPGHGASAWGEILRILEANGYNGAVCIELEDSNFNAGDESEQQGILTGAQFLSGV
jgi:sugar phosphate isomerase/epimerase